MWLIKMAWKNMWRNRNRTAITVTAIFFAVILSVITSSLWKGVFDNLIKNVVSFYSGYAQVHKTGYWEEQILDNGFENDSTLYKNILKLDNIAAISPRLESFALAASDKITKGCIVVGIEPENEERITGLKEKLLAGNYPSINDNAVMLAEGLANKLGLHIGDQVALIGQGYHGSTAAGKYPIAGIIKFGSPDLNKRMLYMPLPLAQEMYAAEGIVTSYVLSLENPDNMNQTTSQLRTKIGKAYEVLTWEEMMPEVIQHIRTDTANLKIIQGILYLLICFGIFGTLLMMMAERKFEMGMLVAIGMGKSKLIVLLLAESVITVITGCVLGLFVSIPIVIYLKNNPIRFSGEFEKVYERFGFEPIWPASVNTAIFLEQGIIVLVIGLVLSLYPVFRTLRLDPVSAMRR